ncbi:MAG: hypothetical protein ACI8ZM_005355 [Crocinitomix sp.]|jgi:hypothetical protein
MNLPFKKKMPVLKAFTYYDQSESYVLSNEIEITNAPDDANWESLAVLADEENFRLYCLKFGTNDTLYQFGFNGSSYEFDYNSIAEMKIEGVPENVKTSSLS